MKKYVLYLLALMLISCQEDINTLEVCECNQSDYCPMHDDGVRPDTVLYDFGIPHDDCFNFELISDVERNGHNEIFGRFYANGRLWNPNLVCSYDTVRNRLDCGMIARTCGYEYRGTFAFRNLVIQPDDFHGPLIKNVKYSSWETDSIKEIDIESFRNIIADSLRFTFRYFIPFEPDVAELAASYGTIDSMTNRIVVDQFYLDSMENKYYLELSLESHFHLGYLDEDYEADTNYVPEVHITHSTIKGYPRLTDL